MTIDKQEVIHEDIVKLVAERAIKQDTLDAMLQFHKAIADETRLKILMNLAIHELCVRDLAYLVGMSKSAISHQLLYLREANLVKSRKKGRNVYYSLSDQHVVDILSIGLTHIQEEE